ncbi:response regulator receiver modulated diguanylate phosphodiesterase [Sideroxydans lithotrophicus ES-1]|uniref:Response regulator receiver modulated diguanylate phosphodiesterase n=2 Tax=Sideroxydans TaxID=314343 RepID=D5CMY8_SIDLE|nr:response regulator receiver modulated diguanylate phosphodiesterase [Sideroxydans lithotrophicus ES-1]
MQISELNVLIVEDDDFQRQTLSNMLRSLGLTSISGASNGRHALEIIHSDGSSRSIDVALCDLNMPEMDGMEFLRHLSQEHSNIAIIITSALDGKLLASVGKMTRMHGIQLLGAIEKPILLTHLKELLSKYDNSTKQESRPVPSMNFTLEEILHGIRGNQFMPFFQPKVDLKTGRIVGAEALARWNHPKHGVVAPDAFISPLEKSGNIDDLTFMMLEKSATECRALHDKGHLLTVSVNLSLVSLNDSALADRITQSVRKLGVEPQYIVLEITESSAMTDTASALENLARLCMNGFSLSIDDYGTGYSSLQQLTRIAFSELKIDKSFVKDFADNDALRIVVESSIDMAHKLQVKSVAEGVETQQDWETLSGMGCDTVQGYFIAKPMDARAFHDFVTNYKSAPIPRKSAQDQTKKNILVVDDDDFTRKILVRVLGDFGFTKITGADNARSAIKLLESNTFDLIITDVDMPGMNGMKFVQLIRSGKTHAKHDTRIVVVSSFSQTEVLGTAFALDINGFLVKPIIPAVVHEKITQALSERLHLRAPVAYDAVMTELKNLPRAERHPSYSHDGAAITIDEHKETGSRVHNRRENLSQHHLSLHRLRPGMTLKESVRLKDGTLILSAGHTLSELSINRLNDLKALLPAIGIIVHENP